VGIGNCSGRTVDKFARYRLTPVAAAEVKPPLIAECYASLECRVADARLVNRYNFFILEVVRAWVDTAIRQPQTLHHRGNGVFAVAGETVRRRSAAK
jgi:flavin reductase (DIM6/NTAB) family NADH-FMN oxidoreductase RutF